MQEFATVAFVDFERGAIEVRKHTFEAPYSGLPLEGGLVQ